MEYIKFEYDIITRAGLTVPEAAAIADVSPVIMWKYVKGTAEPRNGTYKGKDLRRNIHVTLTVLNKLVEKGSLPKVDLEFSPRLHPEKKAKRAAIVQKIKALVAERVELSTANE